MLNCGNNWWLRSVIAATFGPALLAAGGCGYQVRTSEKPKADEPAAPVQADEPKDDVAVIHKTTRNVLNLAELKNDPDWSVVETGASGNDPLTQAQSVYFHAAATITPIPIQQFVQQHQALNGELPSYEQVVDFMKQNPGVELRQQKPWQEYAYDPATGKIVVVESASKKKELLKKAGVEVGDS